MKYMPILPVGMSGLFKMKEITSAFILPQFWDNPFYSAMYLSRPWKTVIIDNAMYENPIPVPFSKLIEIAEQLNSERTFIVAPEDHSNPINTAAMIIETIDEYGHGGPQWEPMTIVHGTPGEISDMFSLLDDIPSVAYGVAVSCWRNGFDRTVLKSLSKKKHYFHAMGLDSISEGIALRRAGYNSVDSSMVATSAVNKIHMDLSTVIFRTGKPSDPIRVPLMQDRFEIDCIDHTRKNILKMHSWLQQ